MSNESGGNANIASGLTAMFQAAKSGGDLRSAFNSPDSIPSAPEVAPQEETEESAEQVEASPEASETTVESADAENDSPVEAQDSEKAQAKSDIEEITITDSKGKRTLKVDFSDRDKLKKMVQLAAGARKWQQERDQERAERAKQTEEYKKLSGDMAKFEQAYGEGGVKGIRALVELLEGPEGVEKFVQEYSAEKDRWEQMDPDERSQLIRQQEIESERSKVSKLEQEYKAKLDELTSRQEKAEIKTLESKLHPAFDRYRFSGKLGDPVAEHRYDTAIWNQAMEALEQYPEDVELTPALIEKEFRNVSQAFGKVINKQVDNKVQKVIRKTKEDATRKAQATVSKTMQTSSAAEQFQRDVRSSGSGNIANALRSLMSGQVKLK